MHSEVSGERLNESLNNSRGKRKRTIEDFEFVVNENSRLKTSDLGKGSYGTVKKAKDRSTGKICAIKIMNKRSIFEYSNKENLKREINIQKSMAHPHIVKLYTYFEDHEYVYLVLEYAENGNLFSYLNKYKKLQETEAFVFFFQTCLGIDYLHKKNIVHRDLKPENLLLDKEGNIKLCDFGWSADTASKRQTFCGTVDYMAPEMVKNHPHDHRLDIWCLGILLYEMLHGYAPFKGRNDQEKCTNIMTNATITFDSSLSPEVVDLIKKILQPAPINRLTMNGIFKHPWMKSLEKNFNIDVMSYVNDQDQQLKKFEKDEGSKINVNNLLNSLKTSEKPKKEINIEAANSNTNAKIITILNTSPLAITKKQTSEDSKKFYFTESTKGSETSSLGSRSNGSGANESLIKPYQILSTDSDKGLINKVDDFSGKKNSYEAYETKVGHIVKHNSQPQPEQSGLQKMMTFGEYKNDYRRMLSDKYVTKDTKENDYNATFDVQAERNVFGFESKSRARAESQERKNSGNKGVENKIHQRRYTNFGFITEHDEDMDNQRLSRISKKNREIPQRKFPDYNRTNKDLGFFEKILVNIGCLARDQIDISKS